MKLRVFKLLLHAAHYSQMMIMSMSVYEKQVLVSSCIRGQWEQSKLLTLEFNIFGFKNTLFPYIVSAETILFWIWKSKGQST